MLITKQSSHSFAVIAGIVSYLESDFPLQFYKKS